MERVLPAAGLDDAATDCDSLIQDVAAFLAVFMSAAVSDADSYRQIAGRNYIHAKDIHLAMMRAAVPNSTFWTDPEMPGRVDAARMLATEMAETREDDNAPTEDDEPEESEPWCAAHGTDLAVEMNTSQARFDEWQPEDGLLRHIRNAVVKAGEDV